MSAASAMILQHPDIQGFFVSFMIPASGVIEACRAAERPDLKIVTGGSDLPTLLDMASSGNIVGLFEDSNYMVGVNSVVMAALGLLGKTGPEYAVSPGVKITLDNLREVWQITKRIPLPEEVDKVLKEKGY